MNPLQFRDELTSRLNAAGITATAADGAPGSGLLYGIVTRGPGAARTAWQIVSRDTPSTPRPAAAPPAPPAVPASGPVSLSLIEHHMATAAAALGALSVERYSTRPKPPVVGYGVHVDMPGQSALFIQRFTTRTQQEGPHDEHPAQAPAPQAAPRNR